MPFAIALKLNTVHHPCFFAASKAKLLSFFHGINVYESFVFYVNFSSDVYTLNHEVFFCACSMAIKCLYIVYLPGILKQFICARVAPIYLCESPI